MSGKTPDDDEEVVPIVSSKLTRSASRKASMTMARAPSGLFGADSMESIRSAAAGETPVKVGDAGKAAKEAKVAKATESDAATATAAAVAPSTQGDSTQPGAESGQSAPPQRAALQRQGSKLAAAGSRRSSLSMARAPSFDVTPSSPGTQPNVITTKPAVTNGDARVTPAAKPAPRSSMSKRQLSGQRSTSNVDGDGEAGVRPKPGMWATVKSWFRAGASPNVANGRRSSASTMRRGSSGEMRRDMTKLRKDSRVGVLPRMP